MTDRPRQSRWSAATLLAPASAAVFAGSVAWAADHPPASAQTTAASTADPGAAQTEATRRADAARALAERSELAALREEVGLLREQVAALRAGGTTAAGGTSGRSTPPSTATRKRTSTPAPARPAPAPATQATTGGS